MTNPNPSRRETMVAIYMSGYAIYGVGKTTAQAIADANEWLGEPITEDDLGDENVHGDMCKIEITPELYAEVQQHGGAIPIRQLPNSSIYGTKDQEDAAWNAIDNAAN